MSQKRNCDHCHTPSHRPIKKMVKVLEEQRECFFCCQGCAQVYELIHHYQLADFYQIDQNSIKPPLVLEENSQHGNKTWSFLDDSNYNQEALSEVNNLYEVRFYLEGIHCLSCLWLLERLSHFNPNVILSRLQFSQNLLTVRFQKNLPLSQVAILIASLGYKPHLVKNNNVEKLKMAQYRQEIKRLAWSFFAMGNIMLWSWAIYLGAPGPWEKLFQWLIIVAFIPVLTYSALPFYREAYNSLKQKRLSIDLPIVIALLFGMVAAFYGIVTGKGSHELYLDTLSTLIFLILFSRFTLNKATQNSLDFDQLMNYYLGGIYRKFKNTSESSSNQDTQEEDFSLVHSQLLKENDVIEIQTQDIIPADGKVVSDETVYLDNSTFTGEVTPFKAVKDEIIFAGAQNLSRPFTMKLMGSAQKSRLGRLLEELEMGWSYRSQTVTRSMKLGQKLVGALFLILLVFSLFHFFNSITLFWPPLSFSDYFSRLLAMIIITCPCALGLTIPLSFSLTLDSLAQKKILVKNEKSLEKLMKIQTLYFDKTGTLTSGKLLVTKEEFFLEKISPLLLLSHLQNDQKKELLRMFVHLLQSVSSHPLAKSVRAFYKNRPQFSQFSLEYPVDELQKILGFSEFYAVAGLGVRAASSCANSSNFWEIRKDDDNISEQTVIALYYNKTKIYSLTLADDIKNEAFVVIKELKKMNKNLALLSGDAKGACEKVANALELVNNYFQQSPEEKKMKVSQNQVMMIGDGANDAPALREAHLSVAMRSAVEVSLKVSDIILLDNNLTGLITLFRVATKLNHHLNFTFAFALLFNVLGLCLGAAGYLSPLLAAILMPLSSFIVLAKTLHFRWSISQLK